MPNQQFLVKSIIDLERKQGLHLTFLATILLVVVGVVTGLMIYAFHVLSQQIANNDGGIALAGASLGLGVAVAGVLRSSAKMLSTVQPILKARGEILRVTIEEINRNSDMGRT